MEAILKILSVAVGGSLGAVARYLINISPLATVFDKFPLPTFLINIIGSFLIGFLMIVFADKMVVNENVRMAVIVGFLGAFTTFSTLSIQTLQASPEVAILNVAANLTLGLIGVLIGRQAAIFVAGRS